MGNLGDREGSLMASRGRFRGHRSWLRRRIGGEFSFNFLPNSHDFCHDQAMIGPRSGHDCGPGHSSIAVQSTGGNSTT